eukprot:TRINITY_DN14399_c0_g1_i1.p1 TRINITY_DN14399_c0_g1~~TRINITY_DN14399_c0_g1_i1.p1  ORF type:complete len:148 (-),score=22.17 TRINITY_DN14399_c0_g1_i1:90-533(-)
MDDNNIHAEIALTHQPPAQTGFTTPPREPRKAAVRSAEALEKVARIGNTVRNTNIATTPEHWTVKRREEILKDVGTLTQDIQGLRDIDQDVIRLQNETDTLREECARLRVENEQLRAERERRNGADAERDRTLEQLIESLRALRTTA